MAKGTLLQRIFIGCLAMVVAGSASPLISSPLAAAPVDVYRGACDASAAIALDQNTFAVADDEDSQSALRIYRFGQPNPISVIQTSSFLNAEGEVDIEGAEKVGDGIYWIGSHSRSSKDKEKRDRNRLFMTRLSYKNGMPVLKPSGTVHTTLLLDLSSSPMLKNLHLGAAATRSPESAGGLNIEALGHSGVRLLIGFRGPLSGGKAIVVTLSNPRDVVAHAGAHANLSAVALLSLGGRGIRGMATLGVSDLLLVAGPEDDRRDFALYRWAGQDHDAIALPAVDFGTMHPEGVVVRGPGAVYVVSDDGEEIVDGKRCSQWPFIGDGADRKRFRMARVPL